jgi:hypothetical protein
MAISGTDTRREHMVVYCNRANVRWGGLEVWVAFFRKTLWRSQPEMNDTAQCTQKLALLTDGQTAMGELVAIHNQEVIALLAEDFDRIAALRSTLQAARNHKARLIDLYRERHNARLLGRA